MTRTEEELAVLEEKLQKVKSRKADLDISDVEYSALSSVQHRLQRAIRTIKAAQVRERTEELEQELGL